MEKIKLDEYKELIKNERDKIFSQPYELVYRNFLKLNYHNKSPDYFKENASEIIEKLRFNCWKSFLPLEEKFTTHLLKKLVKEEYVNSLSPIESITWFVESFPEHIYALILSNTQSRRSRAGKEFEAIIELILIGAGIKLDSQANIGKLEFMKKGLGKMVDIVSPGVIEYTINKRNTILISAKTTLRERWQEVPEELGRTGAMEMFLVTLDDNISKEVLDTLYEANIQITTTKRIKDTKYKENSRVLSFEDLISLCISNSKKWENFIYSSEEKEFFKSMLIKQIEKHKEHEFVKQFYEKQLD
ncbi:MULTISPECIES: type II restriction endonuclease [unclassified Mycoplasma]|uniref:type II restriction endonuclease n=1 Tax=unclassified Mycoplasma TaxID=2683645 RepID=UPI00211C23B7|nr:MULTISPECIES: type II restriction endonuclease [unclassified Mycoplasma]UUM19768.1 type II restriction endonuclease [Mycoplasma sp. 1578d]UUM24751.1 type II restriction endonuclease [Mycoplasma sp. 3686d]